MPAAAVPLFGSVSPRTRAATRPPLAARPRRSDIDPLDLGEARPHRALHPPGELAYPSLRPPAPAVVPRRNEAAAMALPDPLFNAGHWRMGLEDLPATCPRWTALQPTVGAVPRELDGRLYRNGPGSFQAQGMPLCNIVDGDGCVHAFDFAAGQVRYRSSYVQTRTRQDEQRAGRPLYGGIGHRPPGGILAHLHGRNVRKPANTHVVHHAGQLLALHEGDWPYSLDPETLATRKHDDLQGVLRPGQHYSAHPKVDAADGSLWNIGSQYLPCIRAGRLQLQLEVAFYRTDAQGNTARLGGFEAPYAAASVHDFVLTDRHLVVMLSPLLLSRLSALLLARVAPFETLSWRPELPTYFFVIDRQNPSRVQRFETTAVLAVHLIQAFVRDDEVTLDACCYTDAAPLQLAASMTQYRASPQVSSSVKRFTLGLADRAVQVANLSHYAFDFPRLSPVLAAGARHRYVVGNFMDAYSPFTDLLGVLDLDTGEATVRPARRPGDYSGEFVPISKVGGTAELDFWLVGVALDALSGISELLVFDGAQPQQDAICRLPLPHRLPMGFHGSWVGRTELDAAADR